jgi:diguanylate cyclase (GGDEF)-like protein
MGDFLTYWGYNKELDTTIRFTYFVTLTNLSMVFIYFIIFSFSTRHSMIYIFSFITIVCLFLNLTLLKLKYYDIGRIFSLLIMITCITIVTMFLLPRDCLILFYYYLIPPASIYIFDICNKKDRIFIIVFNTLFVVLLTLSYIIVDNPIITVEPETMNIIKIFTIAFTGISFVTAFIIYARTIARISNDLQLLAHTDPLTSVSNRRVLFNKGKNIFKLTERYNLSFAVILIDIDHFKYVNDKFGHPTGDYVLQELTKIIRENIRSNDLICRYGGEEFAIIIMDAEINNLKDIGEHIRILVQEHTFISKDMQNFNITISLGIVGYLPNNYEDFGQMVAKADTALYTAKETGRNKVIVYVPESQ